MRKYLIIGLVAVVLSSCSPVLFGSRKVYDPFEYALMRNGQKVTESVFFGCTGVLTASRDAYVIEICDRASRDIYYRITIFRGESLKVDGGTNWYGYFEAANTTVADARSFGDAGFSGRVVVLTDGPMTKSLKKGGLFGTVTVFFNDSSQPVTARGFRFTQR